MLKLPDYLKWFISKFNIVFSISRIKDSRKTISLDEYIKHRLNQGETKENIQKELLKDLKEGGQIFGDFRKAIKATPNCIIHNFKYSEQWTKDIAVKKYRWVSVLDNDTCSDCLERHAQDKSMEEWEKEGLPRAGFTACKQNCRCILVDADKTILRPIKKGQAKTAYDRAQFLK